MAAVYTTCLCVLALGIVFWPRHGLWAKWKLAQQLAGRIRQEDALKHILKAEANGRVATLNSLAGALQITVAKAAAVLDELQAHELLTFEDGQLKLLPSGREMGLHVVRAHRLWEAYLAEQTGVPEVDWHPAAEKKEHLLTPEQIEELAAKLGHPTRDPHGDAIPHSNEDLEGDPGQSLNSVPPQVPVVITHIEDEPETVYKQLVALGLRPGKQAFIIEKSASRIRFWVDGNEQILAPVLAQNVSVQLLPHFRTEDLIDQELLSNLQPGQRTRVVGLSAACRGQERRRLLDLGFVPGTTVEVDMISPAGDPTAYRVRGSVVALRREQARLIRVNSKEASTV